MIVMRIRRGGRAVDCTGLENRRLLTGLVSSNLTLSAITLITYEAAMAVLIPDLVPPAAPAIFPEAGTFPRSVALARTAPRPMRYPARSTRPWRSGPDRS